MVAHERREHAVGGCGVFHVNAGSLFPAFRRLERDRLIKGEWQITDNNRRVGGPVTVTLAPSPDLVVVDDNQLGIIVPSQADSGTRIDVTWAVRNAGSGEASGTWIDTLVLKQVGGSSTNYVVVGVVTSTATAPSLPQ
jgi:hypothetical protein